MIGGGTPAAGTFTALTVSGAGYKDLTVDGSGTVGAGATFNATGTGGRQYTAFSTANGAAAGAGAFAIFDEIASKYRLILSNGGKAQISEGGAALGNYAALGGAVFDDITDQSTTHTDGATFDTLYTHSIPASALATNGDMVKAFYSGTWVGTTTATRRFRIQFGGVTFLDITFTGASATTESWGIEVWLMRESATTVRGFARFTGTPENTTLWFGSTNYVRNTSFTLSNANSLVLAAVAGGTGAASGDITASMSKVEWKSAA